MTRWCTALLAVLLMLSPVAAVAASVTSIAEKLKCPTCATTLDVSNAPVAQQMKAQIQERLASGRSEQEIIDEFVREFGPTVVATPKKSGFGLIAWLIPAAAVLIGIGAIPFVTRAWARRRPVTASPAAPLDAEDSARLQRELDAFED